MMLLKLSGTQHPQESAGLCRILFHPDHWRFHFLCIQRFGGSDGISGIFPKSA